MWLNGREGKQLNQLNKAIIASKLTKLRNNESRENVAESIGISVSALQMYENAKRIPKDEIKVKLANHYNVSVQWLFFEVEPHKMCFEKNSA